MKKLLFAIGLSLISIGCDGADLAVGARLDAGAATPYEDTVPPGRKGGYAKPADTMPAGRQGGY